MLLFTCITTVNAQEKAKTAAKPRVTKIADFKEGRVLSKEDVGFINTLNSGPTREVAKDATIDGQKVTVGTKLTAAQAKSVNDKAAAFAKDKKLTKSDSTRDTWCSVCANACTYYNYYWYNGYCICYACDGVILH